MEEKVLILDGDLVVAELTINKRLQEGWRIKSVTPASGKPIFFVVIEKTKVKYEGSKIF